MIDVVKQTAGKLVGFVLILFFVALGVLGIVMPILPGLIFLIIAALIASRHFPALAFVLEQNRYSRKCLRMSNSFMELDVWDKTRFCFWGTVKITVDSLAWSASMMRKGMKSFFRRSRNLAS